MWVRRVCTASLIARISAIADRIFDETRGWLWIGGRVPKGYGEGDAENRTHGLIGRYADRLGELVEA